MLFFMNQINSIFPKFNYFFVVIVSIVLGWTTGMGFLSVIKYLAIMAFPFILSIVLPKAAGMIWEKYRTE